LSLFSQSIFLSFSLSFYLTQQILVAFVVFSIELHTALLALAARFVIVEGFGRHHHSRSDHFLTHVAFLCLHCVVVALFVAAKHELLKFVLIARPVINARRIDAFVGPVASCKEKMSVFFLFFFF
jgi:hypothetical protein